MSTHIFTLALLETIGVSDVLKIISTVLSTPCVFPILLICIVLFIVTLTKKHPKRLIREGESTYRNRYYLLTKEELKFYKSLKIAVTNYHVVIIPKVRLADIVKAVGQGEEWQYQFNRIKSKHIDFLLCDSENLRIMGGIELDDSSHELESQQKNDLLKNTAFEEAQIPLIRFGTEKVYSPDFIEDKLYEFQIL